MDTQITAVLTTKRCGRERCSFLYPVGSSSGFPPQLPSVLAEVKGGVVQPNLCAGSRINKYNNARTHSTTTEEQQPAKIKKKKKIKSNISKEGGNGREKTEEKKWFPFRIGLERVIFGRKMFPSLFPPPPSPSNPTTPSLPIVLLGREGPRAGQEGGREEGVSYR